MRLMYVFHTEIAHFTVTAAFITVRPVVVKIRYFSDVPSEHQILKKKLNLCTFLIFFSKILS